VEKKKKGVKTVFDDRKQILASASREREASA
jgi:hypothetical protein